MGLFNKKELRKIAELETEIDLLKSTLEKTKGMDIVDQQKILNNLKDQQEEQQKKNTELQGVYDHLMEKKQETENKIESLNQEISALNMDVDYAQMGLYKAPYESMGSDFYKGKIEQNRNLQKDMIKNRTALNYFDGWELNGNKKDGQKMNADNMKMVLRAFNNEVTVIINKAKFGNIVRAEEQIKKAATQIDKLNTRNRISISDDYLNLKLSELQLHYGYLEEKQREKEILKEQRAAEKEEARLQKEIEAERKRARKEQSHYLQAKEKFMVLLEKASEEEKNDILSKISEIDNQLSEIEKGIKEIDYRESNKRAGYVYVISNIGSFGPDVYKIGMTRRLEPMERVDELGSASVPFEFDVHAMIFSDDAPALEAKLHQRFDDRKVNMINGRKEFFRVPLDEIMNAVREFHAQAVEFQEEPVAEQYRETLILANKQN